MRRMKILVLVTFLMLGLLVQHSPAALLELLPESSHYQGYTYYDVPTDDGGNLRGRIDFAVYDTGAQGYAGEQKAFTDALNSQGRYIYAYQIFNNYPASDKSVEYFAVFGLNDAPMSVFSDSIDCADDSAAGVDATNEYFTPSNIRGVWEFNGVTVAAGDHSWFLVFSSDQDWVKGDFEIKAPKNDFPVPPVVPEPSVIALFGLGSMILHAVRKKRV